jgi:sterol desaturase/sphingolipid hydroxylase (fatty acid hydroxylase superfamily)
MHTGAAKSLAPPLPPILLWNNLDIGLRCGVDVNGAGQAVIEANLTDAIKAATAWFSQALPDDLRWLAAPAERTLGYLSGAILDRPGRFPWWGLIAALIIATIAFLYGRTRSEDVRNAGFLAFLFPRGVYRNASLWVDLKVGFCNYVVLGGGAINITWRLSGAFFVSSITVLLTRALGPPAHAHTLAPVSIVLFTVALSMASDFGYFLFHWAAHKFPPLWAIHKLHHSAEVMTPLTAARVHPLERLVMGPSMALTTGLIIGPLLYFYAGATDMPTIFGMDVFAVLFFVLGHNLHHSHVWVYYGPVVGRLFVSPAQHQIHHSSLPQHIDRNYAEHWAIWDTIFRTLYLPRGRETLTLGLAGYQTQPHTGVLTAWFKPVAESASLIVFGIARGAALALRLIRGRNLHPSSAVEPEPG